MWANGIGHLCSPIQLPWVMARQFSGYSASVEGIIKGRDKNVCGVAGKVLKTLQQKMSDPVG